MSGFAWLQKQRKSELAELAKYAGMENFEGLRKSELESALDQYLSENTAALSSEPELLPYYATAATRPRRVADKKAVDAPVPPPSQRVARRRTAKAIEQAVEQAAAPESDEDEGFAASASRAIVQTPGRALQNIPLPPTPADVVNVVDRSTLAVRTRVSSLYRGSGISDAAASAREALSTVHSILIVIHAFEFYFLRPEVLPDVYAFTVPAVKFLGTSDYPVMVPDLFLLLSSSFWSPTLLWTLTSSVLPSLMGYFFNLTAAAGAGAGPTTTQQQQRAVVRKTTPGGASSAPDYNIDPLTFSIAKALVSFVVYGQKVTFGGWIHERSIACVDGAVYGGYKGLLVGSAISGLVSIYDAVLKK